MSKYPYTISTIILLLVIILSTTADIDVTNSIEEKENVEEWVKSKRLFKGVKTTHVIPKNVNIPLIRCPDVFHYRFANEFGGFFGVVTIQKPFEVEKIEVELNMSLERPVDPINNLKMILLTDQENILTSDVINWAVIFPYQDLLPNLVSVMSNNRIICRNNVNLGFSESTLFKLSVQTELNMNELGELVLKNTVVYNLKVKLKFYKHDGFDDMLLNNPDEIQMHVRKQKRLLSTRSKNKYSNYMNNNVNVLLPGYGHPPGNVYKESK